jgi:hypothetical protein
MSKAEAAFPINSPLEGFSDFQQTCEKNKRMRTKKKGEKRLTFQSSAMLVFAFPPLALQAIEDLP